MGASTSQPSVAKQPSSSGTQGNPIHVANSQLLGSSQASFSVPYYARDGGSLGQIGGQYVQIWADGMSCPNQAAFDGNGQGCGSDFTPNSLTISTYDPTKVTDLTEPPQKLCDAGSANSRLHMGNLIPTDGDTSALWYTDLTSNGDNGCTLANGCTNGLGVATVSWNNGHPQCSVQPGFWSPESEPSWGSAALGPIDGYIYLAGQLGSQNSGSSLQGVYVARVPTDSVTRLDAYQYWNGGQWSSSRLQNPVQNGASPAAVTTGVATFGSWYYSNYYKQYVILDIDANDGQSIRARTSSQLQGPYSSPATIYRNNNLGGHFQSLYSPQALTNYDPSGKSLVVAASLFGVNRVKAVVKIVCRHS